jgi:hypothetical protein
MIRRHGRIEAECLNGIDSVLHLLYLGPARQPQQNLAAGVT